MPPDRWLVLELRVGPENLDDLSREKIPELLMALGGGGVEEFREGYRTYLPPPSQPDAFMARARGLVRDMLPEGVALSASWQPHEEWEHLWRRGLGPRRVTERITVAPTWALPETGPGEILIELDPGMAFGTAEHATTRGCLRLMDGRIREGDRIADVGSGSGILSIAAAALGAREVMAMEEDPMACQAALENLERNGVVDRVRIVTERVEAPGPLPDAPFQGVVANIQRAILEPLLPAFRESLAEGGWIILSGILRDERGSILRAAEARGLVLEAEDQEDGWWSGAFRYPGVGG